MSAKKSERFLFFNSRKTIVTRYFTRSTIHGKHFSETITMAEMAGISNMSPRNLVRRFEQATSNTPLEYLPRFRIEHAKKMFESKNVGIEQIALKCGYEDMSFFRKIVKRHVGMTPREYKEKYSRMSFVKNQRLK